MKQRYICSVQDASQDSVPLTVVDSAAFDSIQLGSETQKPVTSLFEEHQLQPQTPFGLTERSNPHTSSAFVVLFICLAVLIYLHRNSEGFFSNLLKAGFDSNLANQNARIENSQRHRNLLIVQIVAIIFISLFIAGLFNSWTDIALSLPTLVLEVAFGLVLILIVKRGLIWLLAVLFDLSGEYRFHRFNLNMFLALSGLSVLPMSLLLFYSPQIPFQIIAWGGLGILGFFYLKGLQRGLSIAFSSPSISPLHLFYYLCALEILPVFVLIKIVQNM